MQKPVDNTAQFHAVDQAANPTFFTQFMDTSHAQRPAQSYKQEIRDHLALSEGATILDIGCGTGQDVQELAQIVGPHGRVIGIDNSTTMLETARARTAQSHLPVEYILADATDLPFADASFDGCQASRVLGHLSDPALALAEMVRVARPGARIAVAEGDMDLVAVELPDRDLARKVTHAACDQMTQGWIGRQMPRLFQQAGLIDIKVRGSIMTLNYAFFEMAFSGTLQRAQTMGAISEEELTRFWDTLKQAERAISWRRTLS